MALNVDVGAKVSSIPHRDMKNLSVGLCVIFVFGMPFSKTDLGVVVALLMYRPLCL